MMRKKFVAIIATLAVLGCCASVDLQAQATYSCPQFFALVNSHPACLDNWPPLDFNHVPPTAVCCNPGGIPFGLSCSAPTSSSSPPPNSAQETSLAVNEHAQPGAPTV